MRNPVKMVTRDQLDRRTVLKGVTLGAGAVVLQPFLQRLEAQNAGQTAPKRFIFAFQMDSTRVCAFAPNNEQSTVGIRRRRANIRGSAPIMSPSSHISSTS